MAITREQLEFKIGVESGQLIKSLDEITGKTKKLSKDTDDLEGSIKNVSKTEALYQQAIENTVKTMQTEQDAISEINDRLNVFSQQLENINDSVNRNGFSKIQSSLISISEVMQSLIPISSLLFTSMMKIGDPAFAKRLDRVLSIFQLMATLKGFDKLASFIEFIREKVDLLHDRLVVLQKVMNYLNPPTEQVITFSERVDNLSNSIASLKVKAEQGQAALDAMTNPTFATRINDVLIVAQAVASIKGFDVLAASIGRARVAVQSLLDTMREFNNNGLSASENFSKITGLSKAYLGLKSVLEGVYTGIKIILASLAAGFAVLVGLNFMEHIKGIAIGVSYAQGAFSKVIVGYILSLVSLRQAAITSVGQFADIFTKLRTSAATQVAATTAILQGFWKNISTGFANSVTGVKAFYEASRGYFSSLSEAFRTLMKSGTAASFAIHTAFEFLAQAFVHMIAVNIIETGQQIAAVMDKFTEKAAKAEQATAQFEFTVKSFGDTIGVNAVGSLEGWTQVIEELGDASASTRTELQKSSKLLIADGVALGLSFQDSTDLLRRGVDIAANSGRDLFDVTQALLSGISGTAQAVIPLGINLSAHALEHSDLNKQMMKTSDSMTELEKKEIRLSEIMRQTIPIMGASGAQRETLIGINKRLEKSYDNISVQIGANNVLILKAKSVYADFIQSLESVPTIFYSLAGAAMDISSIFLIGAGVVLKYSVTVLSLVGSYKFLSSAIQESIGFQKALNSVMNNLGKAFAFQAVAVTNMATLYTNLKMIVISIATQGFTLMASAIATVTAKIYANTVAVLSNPLFWKAAAIVAGITTVIYAFKELNKEIGLFSLDNVSGTGDTFAFLLTPIKSFIQILKSATTIAVEFAKQVIIGLTAIGLTIAAVGTMVRRELSYWFSPDRTEDTALSMYIDDIVDRLTILGGAANKSRESVGNAFSQIMGNSSAMADEMKLSAKAIEEVNFKLKALEDASKSIDFSSIRTQALGTEVEKLKDTYQTASAAVEKATLDIVNGIEDASKSIEDYKKALIDQANASLAIDNAKIKSLKQISDITDELTKEALKNSGDETKAIISGFADRRKAVKEFETVLANLGPVSTEAASKIKAAYKAIETAQKMALSAAQKKREDEAIAETIKVLKEESEALKSIAERNRDISKAIAGERLTAQQKIMSDLAIELEALDERLYMERASRGNNSEIVKALELQKILLVQNAEVQKRMADMELPDWIYGLGKAITDAFGKKNIDSFFDYVSKSINNLKNSEIVLSITEKVTRVTDSVGSGVGSGLSKVGEAIADAGKVAYNAGGALLSAVTKAGGWVGGFIDVIMNADKYLRILLEFPKMFLSVLKNLPGLVKQFVDQFPGMIRAIAEALPTILIKLVDMIPSFIAAFLDALPLLIERLAEAIPEIFIKIVGMIPKIAFMIARAFFLAIQSFIKGLIRGIGRVLSGVKMPKVSIDTTETQKQFKKIAGTAGRLFSVKDLAETVKDPLGEMTKGIEESFKKGTNWIKQAWQWVYDKIILPIWNVITKAWSWVMDNIVTPIANAIKGAWTWIYETIIQPIINGLRSLFNWVYNKIFGPITETFMKIFSWVSENIFIPFTTALMTVFTFINDTILKPVSEAFRSAFTWVYDNVVKPLSEVGQKIAAPIVEAFNGISDFFKNIGEAFKSLFKLDFSGFAKSLGDAFNSVLGPIMGGFKKVMNGIIDFLNNIKIPGVEVGFSVLGKKISFGWGEIDLLPGDIQRLAKGGEVSGMGLGTDTVPAMLTPGEFVMSRRGVNTAGLGMLESINSGQTPSAGNTYNIQFEINVEAKQTMDEGFIRQQLIPKMRENLKRASLDGEFVLSSKGVRT